MKKCPECSSENIIQNALAIDQSENYANRNLSVAVDEYPDALMFKQRVYSPVDADVCGDCGFTQFYAKSPQILWTAYQNQKKNVS